MDNVDRQEVPRLLVEEYLQQERGARSLLDELERLHIRGEYETVRERIRNLAEHEQGVFYTVAFSIADSEQFFEDVESQMEAEVADRLRELSDSYSTLAESFEIVRTEYANDRFNLITGLEATTTYQMEEEVPLIDYTPRSGNVELYTGKKSPQELLEFTEYLLRATNDSLEASIEKEHSVNTEELGALIERHEELESRLNRLQDRIDELRRRP